MNKHLITLVFLGTLAAGCSAAPPQSVRGFA